MKSLMSQLQQNISTRINTLNPYNQQERLNGLEDTTKNSRVQLSNIYKATLVSQSNPNLYSFKFSKAQQQTIISSLNNVDSILTNVQKDATPNSNLAFLTQQTKNQSN